LTNEHERCGCRLDHVALICVRHTGDQVLLANCSCNNHDALAKNAIGIRVWQSENVVGINCEQLIAARSCCIQLDISHYPQPTARGSSSFVRV
jgi:hypothetical protein